MIEFSSFVSVNIFLSLNFICGKHVEKIVMITDN